MGYLRHALSGFMAASLLAAPGIALAQQADPYVSCVKCHALPAPQAQGQLGLHGSGFPPTPETACAWCHDTDLHEQNPDLPPAQPYFLQVPFGAGSYPTSACTGCHAPHAPSHPNDVFPYFDATPPAPLPDAPSSVLPLFAPGGMAIQNPDFGGIVCSTCHDPHEPAYPVNGVSKFLRIGSLENFTPLCSTCHTAEATPPTYGADVVIPGRFDAVRFTMTSYGDLELAITFMNRGNIANAGGSAQVSWVDEAGMSWPIGDLPIPVLGPDQEMTYPLWWTPSPDWAAGNGSYVFSLPPSDLLPGASKDFVRAMYLPPAPLNLRIDAVGPNSVHLLWDPPAYGPFTFDVYRDGVFLANVMTMDFFDIGVAPETPHVYTVRTNGSGGLPSGPSNTVAATTLAGTVIRVPQDVPTIQAAIDAAAPGTSIHVAPGTYSESLVFEGKEGVTVKGQDANSCILDYPAGMGAIIDLGWGYPSPTGATLAGFTIRGDVLVQLHFGDVVTGCVLQTDWPLYARGGLAAQCSFGLAMPSVEIFQWSFFAAVNSIMDNGAPFGHLGPPSTVALLLNNNFGSWPGYDLYQGSGNFGGYATFESPGPPESYFTTQASVTTDRGLPLGAPYNGVAPDVGAFEVDRPYTPKPPSGLTARMEADNSVWLEWTTSTNLPPRVQYYRIYRATEPSSLALYASVPAGYGLSQSFIDSGAAMGETYYYQVRADADAAVPPATDQLLSAPTNTAAVAVIANRPPTPAGDYALTAEEQGVTIPVLANDSDPDGDPLFIVGADQPLHGTTSINPDSSVQYVPAPDYFGPDQFQYTVTDGRGEFVMATVTLDVTPVNDAPVADPLSLGTTEDVTLPLPLTGSDVEGNPLTYWVETPPTHGTIVGGANLSYVPAANYNGPDSFTYTAFDGALHSAPATVTITVTPVNDAPVADAQSAATAEDAALPVVLTGSDLDGDTLTFRVTGGPAHGTLSGTAPNLTYAPVGDYNGADSFTFVANDGSVDSAPATVTITVTPVNDAPVANAGPDQGGTVGETLTFSGAASSDLDGTIVAYSWSWGDGAADGSGVSATHVYAAAGTFTVTLMVTDDLGATAVDTVEVTVVRVNLALNQTATASSASDGHGPDLAVDGSVATSWMSTKVRGTQSLKVDLGATTTVSNVMVFWQVGYHALEFTVETSTNGKNWTERYSTASGTGGTTDVRFAPAGARYVRISCTAGSSSQYGINELEVYQ